MQGHGVCDFPTKLKYVEKGVSQGRFGAGLWAIGIFHPPIQHVLRERGLDWDYPWWPLASPWHERCMTLGGLFDDL